VGKTRFNNNNGLIRFGTINIKRTNDTLTKNVKASSVILEGTYTALLES
jgi:hypothetical protein